MQVQYDLFSENDDISLMKQEIELIDQRTKNVQRGLFARHGDLVKMFCKQQAELDELRALLLKEVK
jgi:hypothetical protein